MQKRLTVFAFILGLPLSGCGAKDEYEKICNAEQLSGAAAIADPAEQHRVVAEWLRANVKNNDAIRGMSSLMVVAPLKRGEFVKQLAIEAGYDGPCPHADAMTARAISARAEHEREMAAREAAAPPPDAPPPTP